MAAIPVADLDLDDETREQIVECLETADRHEGRCDNFARQQRKRAAKLAGLSADHSVVLEKEYSPGTLGDLRDRYSINEVTDPDFLADETEKLRSRADALEDRTPEYSQTLERRADALSAIRGSLDSNRGFVGRWDALTQHLESADVLGDVPDPGA